MLQPTKDRLRETLRNAAERIEELQAEAETLRAAVERNEKVFAVGFFSGVAVSIVVRWIA